MCSLKLYIGIGAWGWLPIEEASRPDPKQIEVLLTKDLTTVVAEKQRLENLNSTQTIAMHKKIEDSETNTVSCKKNATT